MDQLPKIQNLYDYHDIHAVSAACKGCDFLRIDNKFALCGNPKMTDKKIIAFKAPTDTCNEYASKQK